MCLPSSGIRSIDRNRREAPRPATGAGFRLLICALIPHPAIGVTAQFAGPQSDKVHLSSCSGADGPPWSTRDKDNKAMMDDTVQDTVLRAAKAKKGSPFLTTKEAAYYLGLKPHTLVKMRMQSRGPNHRHHGRYIFYHIDDLEAWSKGQSK